MKLKLSSLSLQHYPKVPPFSLGSSSHAGPPEAELSGRMGGWGDQEYNKETQKKGTIRESKKIEMQAEGKRGGMR